MEGDEEIYAELKLPGRRYRYYMELHVKALQELTHILDYVMPGIAKSLPEYSTVRVMGGAGDSQ